MDLIVDLFAGGGGASVGIEAALGRHVDLAINHSATALAVHKRNHPHTKHLKTDIWEVEPRDAVGSNRVAFLWASPDCTHFSNAKGDVPRAQNIRSLAWVVVKWAKQVKPDVIMLENVQEFRGWGPLGPDGKPIKARMGETFARWRKALEREGYVVDFRVLNAADAGARTRRKRLFLIARSDGRPIVWPDLSHAGGPYRTAAECIDWSLPCPSIFERKKPYAEKTLWRIAQGIRRFVIENPRPFIVKVNHGKWEPRHEDIFEPMSTVTASQRGHGLVMPVLQQSGYGERPTQKARVLDLNDPLGTIVACGQKHALVAALLKHYGDPLRSDGGGGAVIGADLNEPMSTVTTRDHHSLFAATLATFRGTHPSQPGSASIEDPMPTITAGGIHVAEVRAFLTKYYTTGTSFGQGLDEPLHTVRTQDTFGLVTVAGVDYQIVDIGMRMLQPHELLRAQFGRFAENYDLSPAKTKAAQVRLIGNSVCPELVEQIVRANVPAYFERSAA
jgi:DNA (cytosine-5)-methyltransferase 1